MQDLCSLKALSKHNYLMTVGSAIRPRLNSKTNEDVPATNK